MKNSHTVSLSNAFGHNFASNNEFLYPIYRKLNFCKTHEEHFHTYDTALDKNKVCNLREY